MNQKLSRSKTGPIILSSMPCSLCGSWETNPSWHRCDTACLNPQGVAKLHTGNEIRCSRSWDGTCWFFFCNRCKTSRPHIIGVLRNVRIWHNPYSGKADYTTDSEEYSYYSSEGESCTQEEAEEFFQSMKQPGPNPSRIKQLNASALGRSLKNCVPI